MSMGHTSSLPCTPHSLRVYFFTLGNHMLMTLGELHLNLCSFPIIYRVDLAWCMTLWRVDFNICLHFQLHGRADFSLLVTLFCKARPSHLKSTLMADFVQLGNLSHGISKSFGQISLTFDTMARADFINLGYHLPSPSRQTLSTLGTIFMGGVQLIQGKEDLVDLRNHNLD